jgi:predicted membrane protein
MGGAGQAGWPSISHGPKPIRFRAGYDAGGLCALAGRQGATVCLCLHRGAVTVAIILIFIGAILIVSAFRDTQGQLASALEQDVPPFLVWAVAIFAIGAIGYIPKMQPISRALMALVVTVIVLRNYSQVLASFTGLSSATASTAGTTPATTAAAAASSAGTAWAGSPSSGTASGPLDFSITNSTAGTNAAAGMSY